MLLFNLLGVDGDNYHSVIIINRCIISGELLPFQAINECNGDTFKEGNN